jgi:hypothetical protein
VFGENMNILTKMFTDVAKSSAKSLLSSGIKKSAKDMFAKYTQKTDKQIEQEIINALGYSTQHFKLDKNREVVYKPSSVFFYEWLTNNPETKNKLLKDDENGQIFYEGELLTNQIKLELIDKFLNCTGIKSVAVSSHFDQALKLLTPQDFTSTKFASRFPKWIEGSESVIDNFLQNCFKDGLDTDPEYARFLFRKWIVGAAKRAIEPGSSFQGCFTIQGPAGVGKTSFFRNLLPDRTGEILCSVKNAQKFVENIIGRTIVCFDELSVLDYPSTQETFKSLLTLQNINVRLAWRRDAQNYLLRQAFSATTNKDKFIPDQFFSRRLWTISLNDKQRLDFDYLFANRDKLWSEAIFYAKKNESVHLSLDEQRRVEEYNTRYLIDTKTPSKV